MTGELKNRFLIGMAFYGFFLVVAYSQSHEGSGTLQPEIKFQHFNGEDGLGHNRVTCILQDRRGFLWVGTLGGLWRYDGYSFKHARYANNDSSGLSAPEIQCLYEDSEGNLWVGMQRGGLNLFDRETGKFIRYEHDPADSNSLSDGTVRVIYEDWRRPGELWIGTSSGLCQMRRDEKRKAKFYRYHTASVNKNNLSLHAINAICQDSSIMFWIGMDNGLSRFDSDNGTFTHYKPNFSDSDTPYDLVVRALVSDGDSLLWLGTFSGLIKFSLGNKTFTRYRQRPKVPNSLSDDRVNAIFLDEPRNLWIATADGLNRFDTKRQTFTSYQHDPDNPHSLSDNQLLYLYKDRSELLWIGSGNGGLNKLILRRNNFEHYKRNNSVSNTLSSNRVLAIQEDRLDRLWIGTNSGLNRFDGKRHTTFYFQHDLNRPNSSLSSDIITAILEDSMGRIWIGTDNGLNQYNPKTESFVHFAHEPENSNSLSHSSISTLHEGHDGVIWVGTRDGLNKLVLKTDEAVGEGSMTISRYYPDPVNPSKISDNFIQAICEDRQNTVWIGTAEGLSELDQDTGSMVNYRYDHNNPVSLSYDNVWSIYEDNSGALWIGTAKMLDKFDRNKKTFKHYDPYVQRFGYGVNGLLEDIQGNLWFSGSNGLVRFYRQTESFRHFDVSDGLQSNRFTNAHYKTPQGKLFYGGANGFNAFFPQDIQDNLHVPPIVFTAFKQLIQSDSDSASSSENALADITIGWSPKAGDSSPILQKTISETKEIVLTYKDNSFLIEFAALDFTAPERNQYAYKLEGFSDNWIHLGTKHDLTLTGLAPGEYTLRVKGSNNDGVWNEEGASLKITITPPWWRTMWAYTLYGLLILTFLWGTRRYEMNRQRLKHNLELEHAQAEKLQELDRMKSRFFANISHEFRTPLTLILGPIENLRQRFRDEASHEELSMMRRNGQRLLRLINQLLDLSRLEAGKQKLMAQPGDLRAFIKGIVAAFESLARQRNIDLRFEDHTLSHNGIEAYFDRDKIEKVFNNLLSNAFKFTPEAGKISVQLSVVSNQSLTTEHWLLITVTDSGSGISPEQLPHIFERFYTNARGYSKDQQGVGIGLALTKELVKLHHGEITVDSTPGKGAAFTVRLPLGKAHLKPEEIVEEALAEAESFAADFASPAGEGREHILSAEHAELESGTTPLPDPPVSQYPNVLIVEDNPDMRAYMRGHLNREYRVLEAEDGSAGFETAAEETPDLIISDIMMPGMDGFELCAKLKTDERTSHIPVILLTAKASRDSKYTGLETGADDYLTKPFDTTELRLRVKNLIAQRRKLRERFSREIISVEPSAITTTSLDGQFLRRAMRLVEENLADEDFSVEKFSEEMGLSRKHLHRKLKALTDLSPGDFVRSLRLKRAAQLLAQRSGNVSEIAYAVGFNNLSYFARAFREQFGASPSDYRPPATKRQS